MIFRFVARLTALGDDGLPLSLDHAEAVHKRAIFNEQLKRSRDEIWISSAIIAVVIILCLALVAT